ncbi:hypothetical protein POTOM_051789 [Populus tomentosa]|uniref:Uncharacterized protein n=1 Tax=Populus tomentosa TaxID=118781 RepID=A0A8X8C8K2_POPTO|nr:hypothetical protein POTOM_051789 [Populus tomentosa]
MKGELQTLGKGSYSLEDYLHKAKYLALSLCGAEKPMDDDDLIVCILRDLRSKFDPIVAAVNARDMFPPCEGMISKLRYFEIKLHNAKTTPSNVAFYTNRNRRSSGHGRKGITCFRYGGPNHKADGYFASYDESAQYKAFTTFQIVIGGKLDRDIRSEGMGKTKEVGESTSGFDTM